MYPFRVHEQAFEVLKSLGDPGGGPLALLQELLQSIFFLIERGERLLQLSAIPEQLNELVIPFTGLVRDSEDCLTAHHMRSLDIILATVA
jgi:hypothetical protein